MIKEWIEEYKPGTKEEAIQALREIMQEIALAGLQRTGFFEKAAFYGGTALRIFHGLERYSEDLAFSLLAADENFSLEPFLKGIARECAALGLEVTVNAKEKTNKTNIDSAFLKADTIVNEIILTAVVPQEKLGMSPSIKIKIEVDKKPLLGFTTEEKLLIKPFSFYIKCFVLPDLFAGKMHALLFRKWKNNVKGRDWYDMEWYIKKGVPLNLDHLLKRAQDSGDWKADTMSQQDFQKLLQEKIDTVSMDAIKNDIVRFIKDESILEIWSANYFKDLGSKIRYL